MVVGVVMRTLHEMRSCEMHSVLNSWFKLVLQSYVVYLVTSRLGLNMVIRFRSD